MFSYSTIISLGCLAGNLWVHSLSKLLSNEIFFLVVMVFVLAVLLLVIFKPSAKLLCCIVSIGLFFVYTHMDAAHYLKQKLVWQPHADRILAIGTIWTIPHHDGKQSTFNFRIEHILTHTYKKELKYVQLYWRGAPKNIIPGQTWQLYFKVKPIHGLYNPGGQDTERIAFAKNLHAIGTVLPSGQNRLYTCNPMLRTLEQLRYFILQQIQAMQLSYGAIISALSVGVSSYISTEQLNVFAQTGTSHLLAISGLHIGLAASLGHWLCMVCWRKFPKLCLRCPSYTASAMAAMLCAFLYSMLAGFSIPTQRALVMISVCMLARIFNYAKHALQPLQVALILCILVEPRSTLLPGFWLSFAAVFVLIVADSFRLEKAKNFLAIFSPQIAIFIGMLPFSLLIFDRYSLLSIAANSLAIPWFSFVIVPLTLLGVSLGIINLFFLSDLVLTLSSYAIAIIWPILQWFANVPHVMLQQFIALDALFIFFNIAAFWLLVSRIIPGRMVAWCSFLATVNPWQHSHAFNHKIAPPASGEVRIYQLDVGQGLATVVRTAQHVLLYDTGGAFKQMDSGQKVILPFLRAHGIQKLDQVIISHSDLDHRGGLPSILRAMPITTVITSIPQALHVKHAVDCRLYPPFTWDGVNFKFMPIWLERGRERDGLAAIPEGSAYPKGQKNNYSCVLKVSIGAYSALLTGDIEKKAEYELIERYGTLLSATLLFVPHHGSETSSSEAFIDMVAPHYVFYATGFHNKFKFPHRQVIQRYEKKGITGYNSADLGMLEARFNALHFTVHKGYRQIRPHYWHTNPTE